MERGLGATRVWAWYLAAVVFAGQYYVVSAYGASPNETLYVVIGASAVMAALAGLAIHRPPRFAAWLLIAASIGAYLAGDAVLAQLEADNVIVPFPSLADWLYLAVYPALIVAFFIVRRGLAPGRNRTATIDSLLVGVAGFGVLAPLYAIDVWNSPFLFDSTEQWVATAYPIGDALLLAAGARLILAAGRRVNALTLLGGAAISITVGDAVYNVQTLDNDFAAGGVASVGWLAFTALLGGAVLHPSVRFSGTSAATAHRAWPSVVPPLALASIVGAHVLWGDGDSLGVSVACLVVAVALIAVRYLTARPSADDAGASSHEAPADVAVREPASVG